MTGRPWKALLALLAAQTALAGTAAALEATCRGGCRTGFPWGLAGFLFYAALLAAALRAGPTRLLFGALFAGLGVHAALATTLFLEGRTCGLCLAAAGGSAALAALAVACDLDNLPRLLFALPWAVVLAAAGIGARAPEPARVTVYTQPDCAYCDEFRDRVLPLARREFGPRLEVAFRPAADFPAVRRTPTVVVGKKVFEGVPPYDELREAILATEKKP